MATIAAVNQVGESIAALLRARRDLLAAENRLGAVPAAVDIAHAGTGRFTTPPPTAGLTVTCYRIATSEFPHPQIPVRAPAQPSSIALDLHYLLAAWSPAVADEQALIAWSMLELARHPVLDRSLLTGTDVWEQDETVQIVPEQLGQDALFRIWDALQLRYRLSVAFRARVVRIGYRQGEEAPAVVATRFGFADTGPLAREPA